MLDDLRPWRETEAIDTTPTGRATWQMIGVLAELERSSFPNELALARRHRSAEV
jgi:hypothetical protein